MVLAEKLCCCPANNDGEVVGEVMDTVIGVALMESVAVLLESVAALTVAVAVQEAVNNLGAV